MTPALQSHAVLALSRLCPVIPVLVIEDAEDAAPLAAALVAGGMPVLEVTLRTPAALAAIAAMMRVPGARVGAGTVLSAHDAARAKAAGAEFAVAPGTTPGLIAACVAQGLPLMPGAATASEVMHLLEQGFSMIKFFPAEAAGGRKMLASLAGPLPRARFCPTGGIGPDTAPDYLALPNVVCVGGSWIAPQAALAAGDWAGITARAKEAAGLRRSVDRAV
ncbi:bifunctional 4-hydroxy-2-oxoglutarate aldolase/2-dehydro-3-deoxy-phosphogluconate aldolase [Pararhodobacter sp. SW119]|uniref:bifunctional 4-hydroxy-2-oxoglutarate aldolase/2-dehydro-3-deoxy-phosphogluconate aldolase n=1 Tax=Pararhodobacter sp. SW119 TaxID=2780075 RepID=UPI001AE06317|nr:bifunctional 4-hydroxy-2-oxoglutarate aldolase/2-dehydro-3-deoxy-phosphogluconate aldolase [Pararhodobacter sp. SW119]